MAHIKHVKIKRIVVWDEESSETTVSIEEYISQMREYGVKKAQTVRSARHYLRSLGLQIDKMGRIVIDKN